MKAVVPITILMLLAGTSRVWGQDIPPNATGRVLLLRSERAIEGTIDKVGNQYRIRRGAGESWVTSDQVVRLCGDWDEAFRYVKARANVNDPDERMRLARWCRQNQLDALALEQAHAALRLRPEHREAKQMASLLERRLTDAQGRHPAANATAPHAPGPVPDADVDPEALVAFTTRVQPILMNTCVHCHSTEYSGPFRLFRVTECGHHGATQRNVVAVLGQLNLEKPAQSPLLIKAVSAHGSAGQAPIMSRQAAPYQALQRWVEQTSASNPHLQAASSAPSPLSPAVALESQPLPEATAPLPPRRRPAIVSRPLPRVDAARATPAAPAVLPMTPETTAAPPVPMPRPASTDPYDPAAFNDGPKR